MIIVIKKTASKQEAKQVKDYILKRSEERRVGKV